ncbi:MAG: N-acyl-D-amino acid deacylase [Planctomycetaceae bacterium]|nr:N-acyl-D-amino acid deacylase [Planctomycetaceae bacterium]
MKFLISICLVCFLHVLPSNRAVTAADPVTADVVLKNGLIVDGTGNAPFRGSVALKGERIVGVGDFEVEQVDLEIDCLGLVIAPGFIDLHNHSDRQVVDRKTRAVVNYLLQGCTTIVTGNCGSGPTDVGEYYRKIDASGTGTNVAHLLPQGALRERVIGNLRRSATAEELQQMKEITAQAMRDGAWGMSTGLIYVPSSYADTEELTAIASVVAEHAGFYASHIRGEGTGVLSSVDEALRIGRGAKLPVHISHFKSSGRDAWGLVREAARMIKKAREQGETVTADQYPYVASSTSLGATLLPAAARAGGRAGLLKRLDDPVQRATIIAEIEQALPNRDGGAAIRIARYAPRQDWVGKTLTDIASRERKTVVLIALEIFRNGNASVVNFSMSEDDVRSIMQLPWVATASDGRAYLPGADKPHPRSYGTFARKIGHYALDQKVLSLEAAVRSSSGLPADILRLGDRGYLKVGHFADVVAFRKNGFIDRATFDDPHQYSKGAVHVFVNGEAAVSRSTPTGALAGRALRHESGKTGE